MTGHNFLPLIMEKGELYVLVLTKRIKTLFDAVTYFCTQSAKRKLGFLRFIKSKIVL